MVGIISSVRPDHSSLLRPTSAPARTLKASNPNLSLNTHRRCASSFGVISRFIEEAYALSSPVSPPRRSTTGFPVILPFISQIAVSKPAIARRRYEPGNLCSRSVTKSRRSSKSLVFLPKVQGATCRCKIWHVISEL